MKTVTFPMRAPNYIWMENGNLQHLQSGDGDSDFEDFKQKLKKGLKWMQRKNRHKKRAKFRQPLRRKNKHGASLRRRGLHNTLWKVLISITVT